MRTQSATIPLADIHFDAADIDEKAAASYFRQMSHKKKPARPSLHIERADNGYRCFNADAVNLRAAYEKHGASKVLCIVHGEAPPATNMDITPGEFRSAMKKALDKLDAEKAVNVASPVATIIARSQELASLIGTPTSSEQVAARAAAVASVTLRTVSIEKSFVEAINLGDRRRLPSDAQIDSMAESLRVNGLLTPIGVRVMNDGRDILLVYGATRLAAAKKLGWEEIDTAILEGTDNAFRRAEIVENLHRAELTVLEHDEWTAEYVRLTIEAESDKPSQVATVSKGGRGKRSGIRAAAKELGIDKDAAHRAVKVDSLTPEAKEVARETGQDDNRSALLDAAKHTTKEQQIRTLRERASDKALRAEAQRSNAELRRQQDALIDARLRESEPDDEVRQMTDAALAAEHDRLLDEVRRLRPLAERLDVIDREVRNRRTKELNEKIDPKKKMSRRKRDDFVYNGMWTGSNLLEIVQNLEPAEAA